jgi:hypothetical protein
MVKVFEGLTKSFKMINLLRKVCNHADLVTAPDRQNNATSTKVDIASATSALEHTHTIVSTKKTNNSKKKKKRRSGDISDNNDDDEDDEDDDDVYFDGISFADLVGDSTG